MMATDSAAAEGEPMEGVEGAKDKVTAALAQLKGKEKSPLSPGPSAADAGETAAPMASNLDGGDDEEAMLRRNFYQRFFPYGRFAEWLSYGNVDKNYLANREFSFTLEGDVYCRWQSFNSRAQLEKQMQKAQPVKIDVGAVYNFKPKDKKTIKASAFVPQERELVFDIDISDYDDVRYCCQGAAVCLKCWPLMNVAIRVLEQALREDFGFEHLLFVFSGRRGIHCWVCDQRARALTQQQRTAIADYLTVYKGGEKARCVSIYEMHPSLQRAYQHLLPVFEQCMLKEQEILRSADRVERVLAMIPDELANVKKRVRERFPAMASDASTGDSVERWAFIRDQLVKSKNAQWGARVVKEIVFQYTYPRLDAAVTKGLNHLLKSPLCAHHKTGKICVPMDPRNLDAFDPDAVPTLKSLAEDYHRHTQEHGAAAAAAAAAAGGGGGEEEDSVEGAVPAYEHTGLKPYMDIFNAFLVGLATENSMRMAAKRSAAEQEHPEDW